MDKNWISLQSIPAGGRELRIDDQTIWQGFLDEFGMTVQIVEPIVAHMTVLPQSDGVLFRGKIHGRVTMPCDRCSNDSAVELNHSFDSFEPFPLEFVPPGTMGAQVSLEEEPEGADEAVIRLAAHGRGIEMNPAALAWEEFSLSLPIKPLCASDCKGLCPSCGCNRNSETCSCDTSPMDPRLAALRGLTIQKE